MRLFVLVAALAIAACQQAPQLPKLQNNPPKPKDIIDAVLALSQSPLSGESCQNVGTEPTDKTIGRFLAGFLAELSNQDARNAITTEVEPGTEGGQPVHVCRLFIRHAQGEDVWSWGVQFSARQNDGVIVPGSIRCLGGG